MSKKINEQKIVEHLAEVVENHWFNPSLAAQLLIKYPIYTQDRIMDLIVEIIRAQSARFDHEWEHDQTSEGLMLASHLAEVVQLHDPVDYNEILDKLPEPAGSEKNLAWLYSQSSSNSINVQAVL